MRHMIYNLVWGSGSLRRGVYSSGWQACLHDIAEQELLDKRPSSFFSTQDVFSID